MRRRSGRPRLPHLSGVSARRRRQLALVFALVFGSAAGVRRLAAVPVPFTTPPSISNSAEGALSVFAADVDGDGDSDALSASLSDDVIAWYENELGDGTSWTRRTIEAAAGGARSVHAADVDGDGDVDALSALFDDDSIAWYENELGDGTSWTARTIATTTDGPTLVFAADVDGDGDLDALSASLLDDEIGWYENELSDGTSWTPRIIATTADAARSVHAADVDGDGDLDALSASRIDNEIAWYENELGDGTSWTSRTIATTADGAYSVYAADVDGDGDLDALSASRYDGEVAWYENELGDGTSWTARTIATSASAAFSVFAADVDGDGDLDALSAAYLDDEIAWYENVLGDGTSWTARTIATVAGAYSVFVSDVDGDGDLDALSASFYDGEIAWHENRTIHRGALLEQRVPIATTADGAYSVFAADVDGDGDLDALSASFDDDEIAWYENELGDGTSWTARTIASTADGAVSVHAADVDGDDDLDALSAAFHADEIAWYENELGDGTSWTTRAISTGTAGGPWSVYAADVDGDGDLDALSSSFAHGIAWYENEAGDGTSWTARVINPGPFDARSVHAADVDGDGDVDALAGCTFEEPFAWYENELGDGTSWTARIIAPPQFGEHSVYAADVDGDGDLDALSASSLGSRIRWHENELGDGSSWTARTIALTAFRAVSVFAADVDGDGDLDALSAFYDDDRMEWYENEEGDGTSWTRRTIATAVDARSVYAADVDGDGDVDALSASNLSGEIAWYPNRGGQFALPTAPLAPGVLGNSQEAVALQIDLEHRGRAGDSEVELASVEFRFENGSGTPLTGTQANALIDKLELFLDDGSGSFDAPGDSLVEVVGTLSLVGGVQSVDLAVADPDVRVAFGESKRYFVVVTMTANASAQVPDSFELFHLTETSSSARDASTPTVPLRLEPHPDTSTGFVDIEPFTKPPLISNDADGATSVLAADVDGDGDLDALSASNLADEIAWYENELGDGTSWTARIITTTADGASSVYAADVDGDGDLDALSASTLDDEVAWHENVLGDGTSWSSRTIATTANGARSVVAADVDGDGDVDALSASIGDDEIAWYENVVGDGTSWTARTISNTANAAISVFAADVDGDGDLDALSASFFDGEIAWYENELGDGTVWTARTISTAGAWSVHGADVDGDGDIDVLSAWPGDVIAWHENELGNGTSWTARTIATTADGAVSVFAADVDGDGDLDALSASRFSDEITWYENGSGDGTSWMARTITRTADDAFSVFAADVDGDGDLDALSASNLDDEVAWYENRTIHRSALLEEPVVIATAADAALSVFAADMDGDGDLDSLSASANDDAIAWYENVQGAGTWPARTIANSANGAYSVYAADVDGDGDLDAFSASVGDDEIAWYENELGDGTSWTARTIATTADGARSVFAADVDGDGDQDALSASSQDDEIGWYENELGDGTSWTARTIGATADGAFSVFAADVDGDADLDALSASANDDEIAWYENVLGDGTSWTSRTIATTADGARSVLAADVDGDGDLDALSASTQDDEITWYENELGDGTSWTSRTIATTADGARSVFVADVDGDGDLDALSASRYDDEIAWYENELGDGTSWTARTVSTSADSARSVYAADVDGDGDVDALSASANDDEIAWYPNRGGQFALPTTALAQGVLASSQADAALQIDLEHRGRAGDPGVELEALELLFENGSGGPLTSAQANALIDKLELFLDDGSGSFELPGDTLVEVVDPLALVSGVLSIGLAGGGPGVEVEFGDGKRYFVVITLTANAASQVPDSFEIFHLTESSSSARDASAPTLPLRLEFHPDTATGPVDTDLSTSTCKAPFELDLRSFLVTTAVTCEAGTTLTAGDGLTVSPTGDLTLRAGERVRLVTDFSVKSGGQLSTAVDPSLEP